MRLARLVALLPFAVLVLAAAPDVCRAHDVNPELPAPDRAALRTERYQPTPGRSDPPDGSGMPFVITGGVFAAMGAASVALAPVCSTGLVSAEDDGICFGLTAASGGVSFGFGVGMLAAGLVELDVFARPGAESRTGFTIDVSPVLSGGVLSMRGVF